MSAEEETDVRCDNRPKPKLALEQNESETPNELLGKSQRSIGSSRKSVHGAVLKGARGMKTSHLVLKQVRVFIRSIDV